MAIDEKGRAAMNCLTQCGPSRMNFEELMPVSAIVTIEPNPRPRGNSVDVNALFGHLADAEIHGKELALA
jgi:hypothetical protein